MLVKCMHSFDLVDVTGKLPDLLTGSVPEASTGVTASHIYAPTLEVEQRAFTHNLSLIEHCTDSASNALNALLKLATPTKLFMKPSVFLACKEKTTSFLPHLQGRFSFCCICLQGSFRKNCPSQLDESQVHHYC